MSVMVDPERLLERPDVLSTTETVRISPKAVPEYRTLDSHAAVGITNERGEVLLADDGAHGPGLPARAVSRNDRWIDAATAIVEGICGELEYELAVRKVRRTRFAVEQRDERISMYNVIFDVESEETAKVTPTGAAHEQYDSVEWASSVPVEQSGAMAEDIRLFV
ncbi:hypothetical protein C480_03639 [Natrialba aegyptia DSM 13077]|uniref:Nudix hydrolase domain-containing protein n=3 Tax=Natrialba TaxID=63742 RepID=M0BAR3_9EURY|nr:hypothetical protein C480_03639 [Natrialba aegyptia DSM 13077]